MRRRSRQPRPIEPPAPGAVVTSLAPSPRDPTKVVIKVDRKRIATLDRREVEAMALAVGAPWSDALTERVGRARQRQDARAYAIRALTHRPMSRAGLLRRLARREVPRELAEAIAEDLTRMGLIDDREFARMLVRSQLQRRAAGRTLLLAKLRQKGIDQATAAEVTAEALAEREPAEDALGLAARRLRTMPAKLDAVAVKRRLYGYLARRGFDPETCARAVERAIADAGGRAGSRG